MQVEAIQANPDPKHVSTSYVERQNVTMRMHMRRVTRLTNASSKKIQNLGHAVALHFMCYNFCRRHQSLGMSPAMTAALTDPRMVAARGCGVARFKLTHVPKSSVPCDSTPPVDRMQRAVPFSPLPASRERRCRGMGVRRI